jgi:hypothetical protein
MGNIKGSQGRLDNARKDVKQGLMIEDFNLHYNRELIAEGHLAVPSFTPTKDELATLAT